MHYRKILAVPLATVAVTLGVLACSAAAGATCAGASELTIYDATRSPSAPPAGGSGAATKSPTATAAPASVAPRANQPAPTSSGARVTTATVAPSARANQPAPTSSGAHTNNTSAPVASGAHAKTPPTAAPLPGGQVPSYAGSNKIGKTFTAPNGVVYTHVYYHPLSYWDTVPLDPENPADPRNFDNWISPYYQRHVLVACHA